MDGIGLTLVFGVLGIFVLIGLFMIRSERKDREAKLQINRSLGFASIDPDPEVVRKISHLYRNIRLNRDASEGIEFELRNVFHKRMADGEMYTFDLVDTSGEEDSHIEKQAVAVVSPQMNLPQFVIFPKMDITILENGNLV